MEILGTKITSDAQAAAALTELREQLLPEIGESFKAAVALEKHRQDFFRNPPEVTEETLKGLIQEQRTHDRQAAETLDQYRADETNLQYQIKTAAEANKQALSERLETLVVEIKKNRQLSSARLGRPGK